MRLWSAPDRARPRRIRAESIDLFTFDLSGLDAGAQSLVTSKLGQDASAPLFENVSPTVADFEVGAKQSGSLTLNGNIFEVLIVAEPTEPERAEIATHLKAKYGLAVIGARR